MFLTHERPTGSLALIVIIAGILLFFVSECLSVSSKHEVKTIPYLEGTVQDETYTGYLAVRKNNPEAHLFYWFAKSKKENAPLILWLNGGPGCSSMIGFLLEHGPFRIVEANKVELNEYSWNKLAHILYIDQPLGVGFSYPENIQVSSSSEAAADLFEAIKEFFKLFPDYQQKPLYLSGESYAGKYIPYFFKHAMDHQKELKLNIKGFMLGNAMIKPSIQYLSYASIGAASGIISYKEKVEMNNMYVQCLDDIANKDWDKVEKVSCTPIFLNMIHKAGHLNPYDVRESIHSIFSQNVIIEYLNDTSVKTALGLRQQSPQFHKCFIKVHERFVSEFHVDVPDDILKNMLSTANLLIYNGQFDLRVGPYGTSEMLRRLNWVGREGFNNMGTTIIHVGGKPVGQFKSFLGLTQAILYGGSHLVPQSAPEAGFEMVKRFIAEGTLCHEPGCDKSAYRCPNHCSFNGNCKGTTCSCKDGFFGSDCSIAHEDVRETTTKRTFSGGMSGREALAFLMKVPNPISSSIHIRIELKSTIQTGKPFLFVKTGGEQHIGKAEDLKRQARSTIDANQFGTSMKDISFPYYNLTSATNRILDIKNAPLLKGQDNLVAIVVYNDADAPCQFTFTYSSEPSSGTLHWFWILAIFTVLMGIISCIEVSVIITRYQQRSKLQGSQQYQSLINEDGHIANDEDDSKQETPSIAPIVNT